MINILAAYLGKTAEIRFFMLETCRYRQKSRCFHLLLALKLADRLSITISAGLSQKKFYGTLLNFINEV